MISKKQDGGWIVTGVRLPLHQVWEFFDKYELVHDMIDGKLFSDDWTSETSREKKISDMLKGSTIISGSVVSDYLKFKDWEKKFVDIRIIEEKLRMLEKKIGNLSSILGDILVSNLEIKKLLSSDAFIDLREIVKKYSYCGKPLYKLGSLRNKIKKEVFGKITIGYLDIDNVHITLLKRGNRWVTPLVHWQSEMKKIDYDYLNRLRYKNKNVYGKRFDK